jgi:hypothetical protein
MARSDHAQAIYRCAARNIESLAAPRLAAEVLIVFLSHRQANQRLRNVAFTLTFLSI